MISIRKFVLFHKRYFYDIVYGEDEDSDDDD